MRVQLALDNFPMLLFESFQRELAKHIEATVQVGGEDTVFVTFVTNDVVKAQEGIIISDMYHFGRGGDIRAVSHCDEG